MSPSKPSVDARAKAVARRREELLGLVERVRGELEPATVAALEVDPATDTTIEQATEDCLFALREAAEGGNGTEVEPLIEDLRRFRDEIRTSIYRRQASALTDLRGGLARLRASRTIEEAIELCPRIACEACGFQAAILMLVRGSSVELASAWSERDPEWFPKVQRAISQVHGDPITLDQLPLEKEMVRQRRPFLVRDAMNSGEDGVPARQLRRLTGVQSYLAAPIITEDGISSFIYAIQFAVDADILDRDLLWAFAEGCGYALERTVLQARLDRQRELLRDLLRDAEQELQDVSASALAPPTNGDGAHASPPYLPPAFSSSSLLSRRELEVMELLSEGATNRMIAERLIISEATAKAHVARILRKLNARNRAEAVRKYVEHLNHAGA